MLKTLRRLLPSRSNAPRLDWIQVELSSACNAACAYCPRTTLKSSWESRFMDPALFEKLVPQLARTGFIHLQGWGESLLHPHFFDILAMAKSTGRPVSMTSNGTLVDEPMAERLVESGVDVLALSVAGASENSNARWRKGTGLAAVRTAAANIRVAAKRTGKKPPHLHLACMVLAEHVACAENGDIDELEGLAELAQELGTSLAVLSSLSLVLSPQLAEASDLAPDRKSFDALHKRVTDMRERAYQMGVTTRGNLDTVFTEKPRCTENVDRAIVIAADGTAAPCVMCTLPLKNSAPRPYVLGFSGPAPLPHMTFGNANDQPLAEILASPERRTFIKNYKRGRVPACCAACRKRYADRFLTIGEINLSQAANRYDLIARDIEARKAAQ